MSAAGNGPVPVQTYDVMKGAEQSRSPRPEVMEYITSGRGRKVPTDGQHDWDNSEGGNSPRQAGRSDQHPCSSCPTNTRGHLNRTGGGRGAVSNLKHTSIILSMYPHISHYMWLFSLKGVINMAKMWIQLVS